MQPRCRNKNRYHRDFSGLSFFNTPLFRCVVSSLRFLPGLFVIPVTLAIVIGQSYTSYPLINTENVTQYSKFMAIPSTIAGCFAAMHLVDFVAPDFAVFLLGEPTSEHIEENFLKFDALYPSSLFSLWKPGKNAKENLEALKSQLDLLHNKSEQHSSISIAPTTPYFRDKRVAIPARTKVNGEYKYTYDLLWQAAMDSNANMVLISDWNGYDNSCAIEPILLLQSGDEPPQGVFCR